MKTVVVKSDDSEEEFIHELGDVVTTIVSVGEDDGGLLMIKRCKLLPNGKTSETLEYREIQTGNWKEVKIVA